MTLKQRKFIRELIRTFSPTEAAMRVYKCKDRKVASVIACQNLIKLNINMNELMESMGLGLEKDINDLNKLRSATITKHFAHEGVVVDEREYDDNATQLKALELTLKLKGLIKEKVEHSGSVKGGSPTVIIFKDATPQKIDAENGLYATEGTDRPHGEEKV